MKSILLDMKRTDTIISVLFIFSVHLKYRRIIYLKTRKEILNMYTRNLAKAFKKRNNVRRDFLDIGMFVGMMTIVFVTLGLFFANIYNIAKTSRDLINYTYGVRQECPRMTRPEKQIYENFGRTDPRFGKRVNGVVNPDSLVSRDIDANIKKG